MFSLFFFMFPCVYPRGGWGVGGGRWSLYCGKNISLLVRDVINAVNVSFFLCSSFLYQRELVSRQFFLTFPSCVFPSFFGNILNQQLIGRPLIFPSVYPRGGWGVGGGRWSLYSDGHWRVRSWSRRPGPQCAAVPSAKGGEAGAVAV